MKKQIIIIHGGTSFSNYNDYLQYLKSQKITIEKLKPKKDWKYNIVNKLRKDYEVLTPQMPNKNNARYKEWEIWFKNIERIIKNNIILIGHSLGGIFLAKYLSQNNFSKKIKATIIVAAPFENKNTYKNKKLLKEKESLKDFALPNSLNKFKKQGGKIYLIYSKDDPIVPLFHLKQYQEILPEAKAIILNNKKHFNQETFPEIIKLIKSI